MKSNSRQRVFSPMVLDIMGEFARLTGLSPVGDSPRRYLWTDAFAVCTFLGLYRQTGDGEHRGLALRLVEQVHRVLGQHREDDPRRGWISGLEEQEGRMHPTIGGLRIGKKLKERGPQEPNDDRLEWDRDGQYYHYLTKWMHALNLAGRVTGDATFNVWAMELARTAHEKFTYVPPSRGQKRMYWKMSIDLSYPLVLSMGHHDPLDGLITYTQLQASADRNSQESVQPDLRVEIAEMADMCKDKNWATDDLLGIGGLLCDACRVAQLQTHGYFAETDLLEHVLDSSLQGLEMVAARNPLELPAEYRLAFRELGLSLGLRAVERLEGVVQRNPILFDENHPVHSRLEGLSRFADLIERIESFWLHPANREARSWREHADINTVMLATSLGPEGFLTL